MKKQDGDSNDKDNNIMMLFEFKMKMNSKTCFMCKICYLIYAENSLIVGILISN